MDKLPFELIAAIFATYVHEYRVPLEGLSWINKHLREIAPRSTKLWTIVYYDHAGDKSRMLVCLDRSAKAQLTIELDVTRGFATDDEEVASIVSILTPHFPRVQSHRLAHYEGLKSANQ